VITVLGIICKIIGTSFFMFFNVNHFWQCNFRRTYYLKSFLYNMDAHATKLPLNMYSLYWEQTTTMVWRNFALYALVKEEKWLVLPAAGGCPISWWHYYLPISITSAIEGLKNICITAWYYNRNDCNHRTGHSLSFLYAAIRNSFYRKMFGPVMLVWFSMLAILGFSYNGRSVHL